MQIRLAAQDILDESSSTREFDGIANKIYLALQDTIPSARTRIGVAGANKPQINPMCLGSRFNRGDNFLSDFHEVELCHPHFQFVWVTRETSKRSSSKRLM